MLCKTVYESILLSGLWYIFVLLYMKLPLLCCCCCMHVCIHYPLNLENLICVPPTLMKAILLKCLLSSPGVDIRSKLSTATLTTRPKWSLTGMVPHQGSHWHGNRRVLESDLTEGWSVIRVSLESDLTEGWSVIRGVTDIETQGFRESDLTDGWSAIKGSVYQ